MSPAPGGMRRTGPILAMALVAAVDAVVLGGVSWNRSGAPEATLTLTEREMPLAPTWDENTGMWLRLAWNGGGSVWGARRDRPVRPDWSSPERLRALGFDVSVPLDSPFAGTFYGKARPLERFAVLEFEGESWAAWLADQEREMEDLAHKVESGDSTAKNLEVTRHDLERARVWRSRLTLVDIGRDALDLRRRYPDRSRYLVARAVARIFVRSDWDPRAEKMLPTSLDLVVSELLCDQVHVPPSARPLLEAVRRQAGTRVDARHPIGPASPASPASPRYAVTLEYGRRLEPWIAAVRPLADGSSP